MRLFKLPDLGEGLVEADIVAWHVQDGDDVQADQPLLAVETAKALVDIPSPQSGRIVRRFGRPGDTVHLGDPLVEFAGAAEDSGTVVGSMQRSSEQVGERPLNLTRPTPAPQRGIRATPAVRALAERLGVDLHLLRPSGPEGLITSDDVQQACRQSDLLGPSESLRGVRRAMAHNMARAHAEVVPVTLFDDADTGGWPADADISLRLIRALIAGCRQEPSLNALYDGQTLSRRLVSAVHLGVAVDSPEGLFVAVLRAVDQQQPGQWRQSLDALKQAVRQRSIPPEDLRGHSIVLSNFGTIAGRHATPVVVPPAVAILGAGRRRAAVLAVDGQPVVRPVMPLSLTFDHRAVTGGEAGRFLAAVLADLERPD